MPNLHLLPSISTPEERIQARIDAFAREIMAGDGDMDYIKQVLAICHDYLTDYEDAEIYHATIKIRESIFYLDSFMY